MTISIIRHKWETISRVIDDSPLVKYIDHPVDLIFADPPYNYRVEYDGDDTHDFLATKVYFQWCSAVVCQLRSMVKDGGTLWWLCPAEYGGEMWQTLERYGRLLYDAPIIWHERFSQYQQKQLTKDYRLLFSLVIGAKEPIFLPDAIREPSERLRRGDKRADPRGRVPGHVWQVRRLQGNAIARVSWHPAQLAPEGLERIVAGWTRPGETVLDAFAGSGSMGMVCKKLDRNFIGVEASVEYCERMSERLEVDSV